MAAFRQANAKPANAALATDSADLQNPQALALAFQAFNELSGELSTAYQALEERVQQLTREAALANRQKLEAAAQKEQLATRLQNLLQLLPGGVVVINGQGCISECNPAALELLGEPLKGLHWRDVITERFAPRSDDGHEISLRNGRRVSLLSRSLDQEPGQIILITDQTETRRLQQQLSRHERLTHMGRMVSSLAHQIRTPLSAAMLYAGHLVEKPLPDEQSRATAHRLMGRLHNMERQVKDMLIFAKGDAVLDERMSLAQLLGETRSAADVLLRSGALVCHWENRIPDQEIHCNREALIGALLNLIENAAQCAGSEARLQIVACSVPSEQDQVCIYVQDNGPGLPEGGEAQVIEPFFTTRAQGTGLGLAVAQVVAKAHRGQFFIRNIEDGQCISGARAGFVLPQAQCGDAAASDSQRPDNKQLTGAQL